MDKPLFSKCNNALEYKYLFKNHDNMNYYSAKESDNYYIMVNDYGHRNYNIWSETPIVSLEDDKLLCKREEKYGVVNAKGWTILPFVYDRFENREDIRKDRYNVLLGNRWGVIDLSGKEIFRVKYKDPIPTLKQFRGNTNDLLCRNTILVEDADTHCQGLVDFDGHEVIPTIYSKIVQSGDWDYVFVSFGTLEKIDSDYIWDGIWGCFDWQGKEIIPVKYPDIHYVDNFFIAGNDKYGKLYDDLYYGVYDLYDLQGVMIIGGFNNCQIEKKYFIFSFGITVKSFLGEKFLIFDEMCAIIVDKDLKSLIPRHLIENTRVEIEYELDFLYNNFPIGKGLLIGEYPQLCKGERYNEDDNIIKGISVRSAFFIKDNVIVYSSNKKITMDDCSIKRLKGLVFCDKLIITPPIYIDIKSVDNELLFIINRNGLVGVRNVSKELLKPQFNLITNPYDNIAIGFKIEELEDVYQCQCCLLKFHEDIIYQEDVVKMTGSQLYELLYLELSDWKKIELSEEHKKMIVQYWEHVFNDKTFWYSYCEDFRYLWEDEHYFDEIEETRENMYNDMTDPCNWEYYNDGLDMDQQDERFWNF